MGLVQFFLFNAHEKIVSHFARGSEVCIHGCVSNEGHSAHDFSHG